MLEPLTRLSLPEQAVRAIKQLILHQQLNTGDQLPSERELTELFGVSRTVVREALQTLVADGLLSKAPGRGVFVRTVQGDSSSTNSQTLSTQTRNLLEVRAALEIGALTFAAQRVTAAELDALAAIVAEMQRRLETEQAISAQDQAFHELLLQTLHNPAFVYFRRLVQDAIQHATQGMTLTQARPADRHTVESAERIVAALRQHNVAEAQAAMRSHLLIDRPPEQARLVLFVDDGDILLLHNLTRCIQPAHKYPHNPVLWAEQPWEGDGVLPSATVLYDNERMLYQLWYHGYQALSPREERFTLCYATSLDGIHWQKSPLDLIEFAGSNANNLVMPWSDPHTGDVISATIFPTLNETDQAHYRLVYFGAGIHKMGLCVASAPDGLQWSAAAENPVYADNQEPVGEVVYCLAEPAADRMVAYYRMPLRAQPRATLARLESHDLHHWGNPRAILTTDEHDPADTELYGLTPFRYGDFTLGLLWVYHRRTGWIDLQLAASRDGVTWTRVGDRAPFLSVGAPGAFDQQAIVRASMPIVVGNELWFYYAGADQAATQRTTPVYRIGLATLPLDRFVALKAGLTEGYVTTKPILCTDQTHLLLNAVVNPGGYLQIEVLDEAGQPVAGFTREQALPFEGSVIAERARWIDHGDLTPLIGRTLHFRFFLRHAALYAFRLAHPNARASDLVAGIC